MALPKNNKESFLKNEELNNINKENKKNEINNNKSNYTLKLIENEYSKIPTSEVLKLNYIPLKALLIAPEHFFDEYSKIAEDVTNTIQDNISKNSNASNIISKTRANPENIENKTQSFQIINGEFIKYDASNKDVKYTQLTEIEKRLILAMTINEIVGLSILDPLSQNHSIREIMCNGPFDVQVEIDGTVKKVPCLKFKNKEHLQNLINRLYNSVNKESSRTNPLERARLWDNSRVFVTHEIVAPTGPNLNIRRHTEEWVSPEKILSFNSASVELFEWLGNMIYNGLSMLIVGGTGSGKTTLLSALTAYFPPHKRIVTIEKNIEMKGCPNKYFAAAMECVPPKPGSAFRGVNFRDLVEASTQMRPDIIILGETTGDESYDILNAANSGHQVFTTIHANSAQDASYRLVTLTSQTGLITGKAVFDLISAAIDIIVVVERFDEGSRKVVSVSEVASNPERNPENGELFLRTLPIWEFKRDENSQYLDKVRGHWEKVGEISPKRRKKHGLDYAHYLNFKELNKLYEGEK